MLSSRAMSAAWKPPDPSSDMPTDLQTAKLLSGSSDAGGTSSASEASSDCEAQGHGCASSGSCCPSLRMALLTMGPGLMACLADTDGPCLITAAQSGAVWGYSLLPLQLLLVPVLFSAQELAARLGVVRGAGMTALLRQEIGAGTAWAVSLPLLLACLLGLVSEYSSIGQTMALWGVPVWASNTGVTAALLGVVATGSYSTAEVAGLAMGICQIAFFATAVLAGPRLEDVAAGALDFPAGDGGFVRLVTANIGAVIMPWMLAYQQSAICNKGVQSDVRGHLFMARVDTALGSLLTQGVMAAMLVTVAAARSSNRSVEAVADLEAIFSDVLGSVRLARVLLTFAVVGACMVAAIVQTLCAAWTFEQLMGPAPPRAPAPALGGHREFPAAPLAAAAECAAGPRGRTRPFFYAAYAAACGGAFVFTLIADDAVDLSVWTEFCNGILMPPIIFALWHLSARHLPPEHRLVGRYKWGVFVVFAVCSSFCLGSIFVQLL